MDSERRENYYTTRFGDVVDANTHETVAWHPALVSPGVYGNSTAAWIAGQMRTNVAAPAPTRADELSREYALTSNAPRL